MINFENYVTIGAKLCVQNLDNPAVAFTMSWLNGRTEVAKKILERHEDFMPMFQTISANDEMMARGENANFSQEFDEMFEFLNRPEYVGDIYYAVLLAAQGTFLERDNTDRENSKNLVQIVNNIQEEASGLQAIAMLTTALWFSDYNGYQNAVLNKLEQLKEEGYFEGEKRILVNGVYWMVIQKAEDNKRLLFLCDEILGMEKFNDDVDSTSYVNSSLRKLMNDESNPASYMNTLFSGNDDVRKRIIITSINDNSTGGPISDKLFLLSIDEASQIATDLRAASFYNLPEKRYWYLSSIDFSPYDWWWLRSRANDGDPSYVVCNGDIVMDVGTSPSNYYGIRPAFWADNSDGYFDDKFVSLEEYEKGRDEKRAAYSKQGQYYQGILNQLNGVHINLGAKMKDLPVLAEQHKNQPQTTNVASTPASKSGGCYIATAVYGSYDCPEVWTLRRYRDDVLASTWYGRIFIKTYYAISPTIVDWFGETGWFNSFWRERLDNWVRKLNAHGIKNTKYLDKDN